MLNATQHVGKICRCIGPHVINVLVLKCTDNVLEGVMFDNFVGCGHSGGGDGGSTFFFEKWRKDEKEEKEEKEDVLCIL